MYLGRIVEMYTAEGIYQNPLHPYTKALLATVPSIYDAPERELVSIPGIVPENYDSIRGCRFADRCAFRAPECDRPQEDQAAGEGRLVRCARWKEVR